MSKFASRIKDLRKEKGLRQKDVALGLELAQTTIANYEQGIRFPDEDTLKKISNYFEVSVDYMLGVTNVKHRFDFDFSKNQVDLENEAADVTLENIKANYINLILSGNKNMASKLIIEALQNGANIKKIYMDIFEYNLKLIGDMWEKGEVDIEEEHYFTCCTKEIMYQLYNYVYSKPKSNRSIILLAVGGELHNIGIKIVSDFLEMEGYIPYFLESNIPTQNILKAINLYKASVLALSVTMDHNLNSLVNIIHAVKNEESTKNTKIIVGGRPFNLDKNLWKHVGADGYSTNAKEAVSLTKKLIE